jgi:hypothetical protein
LTKTREEIGVKVAGESRLPQDLPREGLLNGRAAAQVAGVARASANLNIFVPIMVATYTSHSFGALNHQPCLCTKSIVTYVDTS